MLFLGAFLQVAAQALRAWLPPFPLYAATFFLVSLGQAYQDTHGNTFVSAVSKTAHRWLGFIHAMYMAGCLTGPFVSTAVASATPRWNLFYLFPLGLGLLNIGLVSVAFRDSLSFVRKVRTANTSDGTTEVEELAESRSRYALRLIRSTLSIPSVWLLSLFYFFYLGTAITAGGELQSQYCET
jgi:fucose permease